MNFFAFFFLLSFIAFLFLLSFIAFFFFPDVTKKPIELIELGIRLCELFFALFSWGISWVFPKVHQCHDTLFLFLVVLDVFLVEIFNILFWLLWFRVLDYQGPKLVSFAPAVAHVDIHRVGFELCSISKRILVKETVFGHWLFLFCYVKYWFINFILELLSLFQLRLAVKLDVQLELALQFGFV